MFPLIITVAFYFICCNSTKRPLTLQMAKNIMFTETLLFGISSLFFINALLNDKYTTKKDLQMLYNIILFNVITFIMSFGLYIHFTSYSSYTLIYEKLNQFILSQQTNTNTNEKDKLLVDAEEHKIIVENNMILTGDRIFLISLSFVTCFLNILLVMFPHNKH